MDDTDGHDVSKAAAAVSQSSPAQPSPAQPVSLRDRDGCSENISVGPVYFSSVFAVQPSRRRSGTGVGWFEEGTVGFEDGALGAGKPS